LPLLPEIRYLIHKKNLQRDNFPEEEPFLMRESSTTEPSLSHRSLRDRQISSR
jgi:hypothetical protein